MTATLHRYILLWLCYSQWLLSTAKAFVRHNHLPSSKLIPRWFTTVVPRAACSSSHSDEIENAAAAASSSSNSNNNNSIRGDPLREATGIRPSLHPVTINAISEALKVRAKNVSDLPLRQAEPLQIATSAGHIAAEALQKRQSSSDHDGMILTPKEEQTVAGRVVGVVMRFEELENTLRDKCRQAGWIAKYNEWGSFGILSEEDQGKDATIIDEQILLDPLFCMNRAECLLALFLAQVEAPSLEKVGETVPGGSVVDFLDDDRKQVLLGDNILM